MRTSNHGSSLRRALRACGFVVLFFVPEIALASPPTARLISVDGAEVGTAEVEVLRALVESDLIDHPGVNLLSDADPEDPEMEITANITRLGESYLVVLTVRLASGEQRSRRHKIATFDEIDVATRRLVASLIENIELFDTVERGDVLETEQEPETVVASMRGWEVGFGTAWPISNALDDHGTMYGFHGAITFDIRDFLVDLRTDFQFGNDNVDTFAFTTTLGGRYIWHDARRYGIYSGIDLGYGYVEGSEPGNDPSRGGFVVGGNTGILFLRHSDINLDLKFRLLMWVEETRRNSLPVLIGLGLGVRF